MLRPEQQSGTRRTRRVDSPTEAVAAISRNLALERSALPMPTVATKRSVCHDSLRDDAPST